MLQTSSSAESFFREGSCLVCCRATMPATQGLKSWRRHWVSIRLEVARRLFWSVVRGAIAETRKCLWHTKVDTLSSQHGAMPGWTVKCNIDMAGERRPFWFADVCMRYRLCVTFKYEMMFSLQPEPLQAGVQKSSGMQICIPQAQYHPCPRAAQLSCHPTAASEPRFRPSGSKQVAAAQVHSPQASSSCLTHQSSQCNEYTCRMRSF